MRGRRGLSFLRIFGSPDSDSEGAVDYGNLALGMVAELIVRMSAVASRSPGCGGCVSIKTAAEYRVMAVKCFQWAHNTCINEWRETYLQLAQFWLEVASKLDSPPRSKV